MGAINPVLQKLTRQRKTNEVKVIDWKQLYQPLTGFNLKDELSNIRKLIDSTDASDDTKVDGLHKHCMNIVCCVSVSHGCHINVI